MSACFSTLLKYEEWKRWVNGKYEDILLWLSGKHDDVLLWSNLQLEASDDLHWKGYTTFSDQTLPESPLVSFTIQES